VKHRPKATGCFSDLNIGYTSTEVISISTATSFQY